MPKLSVLIPVFNEETTLNTIVSKVMGTQLQEGVLREIILINDCSSDGSLHIAETLTNNHPQTIRLINHEKNLGKGAAIRTGIEAATGDYIIVQDADLEYDPDEYRKLLAPILDDKADVVFGSRFMGGEPHRVHFFWHSVGNKFLTMLSNMMTNLNLTDMETCFKLFKSDVLKKIKLKENRFGFEPEVTAKVSKLPEIRIFEVGISYYGRTYAEGKKIGWRDGFRAIYCILKYNLLK